MAERLLTGREAAERLAVPLATVRRKARELGAIRIGKRTTRFSDAGLEKFISSHTERPVAK